MSQLKRMLLKHLWIELTIGIVFSIVVFLLTLSIRGPNAGLWDLLSPSLASLIPGVLIGALIGITGELYEKIVETNSIFREVRITWRLERVVQSALDAHGERYKPFIGGLIEKSVRAKVNQITDIDVVEFYTMLRNALRLCSRWEGIHQGSLKLLGLNAEKGMGLEQYQIQDNSLRVRDEVYKRNTQRYFDSLCMAANDEGFKARRIIILSKKNQKDLKDPVVMKSFWEATGRHVTSYWIDQDELTASLRGGLKEVPQLEDAALHDGELFLQYDRDRGVVKFQSLRAMPAPTRPEEIKTPHELVQFLFAGLDAHLGRDPSNPGGYGYFDYMELTEADIPKASNDKGQGPPAPVGT